MQRLHQDNELEDVAKIRDELRDKNEEMAALKVAKLGYKWNRPVSGTAVLLKIRHTRSRCPSGGGGSAEQRCYIEQQVVSKRGVLTKEYH